MSEYNYLVNKLRNRFRNSVIENQINLFQVIDESDGTILDKTLDCNFLAYLITKNPDFLVDSNNQISLTTDQLTRYVEARMYYYNPQLLTQSIFELLNVTHYYDLNWFNAFVCDAYGNTFAALNNMAPYDSADLNMYAGDVGSLGYRSIQSINDVPFVCALPQSPTTRNSALIGPSLFSSGFNAPFTAIVSLVPVVTAGFDTVFAFSNGSSQNTFSFLIQQYSGHVKIRVYITVLGSLVYDHTFDFSPLSEGFHNIGFTGDASNFYCYVDSENALSDTRPDLSSLSVSYVDLFYNGWTGAPSRCQFSSLLLSSDYTSSENMSVLMSLFATKYFFPLA